MGMKEPKTHRDTDTDDRKTDLPAELEILAQNTISSEHWIFDGEKRYVNGQLKQYAASAMFANKKQKKHHSARSRVAQESIKQILERARCDIQEGLNAEVNSRALLMDIAANDRQWYKRASLMLLTYEQLEDVLKAHPPSDIIEFAHTAIESLNVSNDTLDAIHCKVGRSYINLTRRIDILQRTIRTSKDPAAPRSCLYFTLYILFNICYPRHHHHVPEHVNLIQYPEEVHHTLLNMGKNILPEPGQQLFPAIHRHQPYVDAAAGYRLLKEFSDKKDRTGRCLYQVIAEGQNVHQKLCNFDLCRRIGHLQLEGLVSTLQQHAYREIRERTLLAVGQTLPAELVEFVIEKALNAEEVPMEKPVREEIWRKENDRDDSDDEYRVVAEYSPVWEGGPRIVHVTRLPKAMYPETDT